MRNLVRINARDESDTVRLGQDIAAYLRAGDLVTISGELGSGKSVLARAIIRDLARDPELEVPSPTFALMIDYPLDSVKVIHVDLYRVGSPAEVSELGLEEGLLEGALIVEWPDDLDPALSPDRLEIAIASDDNPKCFELVGLGSWSERLNRLAGARDLVARAGYGRATREPVAGDVSGRSYRRLIGSRGSAILMDAPDRKPGAITYKGRALEDVAPRAMTSANFVALSAALRDAGFHAPEIIDADLPSGLLVIEDLGRHGVLDGRGRPVPERYEVAIDLLVALHQVRFPQTLPVNAGHAVKLPVYDLEAYLAELSLFPDWFARYRAPVAMTARDTKTFHERWADILGPHARCHDHLVLLDFHSPNLMWLDRCEGLQRLGLLDFQDALFGHPAYDVASLVQDARTAVPQPLQERLVQRYRSGRSAADPAFSAPAFGEAYAVLAAQRASKVLGAFARLEQLGQPAYAAHIPDLCVNLCRNLAHPALESLRPLYEPLMPPGMHIGTGKDP